LIYRGQATPQAGEQTTRLGEGDARLDVVRMRLQFAKPIDSALFDYFHPVLTDP